MVNAFGELPSSSASDGIVPTLSQVWGEVIHATHADHLDVVGHYGALRPGERTTDWLPSRSGFDDAAFELLWSRVAAFITAEAQRGDTERYQHNVGVERTQLEPDKARQSEDTRRELELITAADLARQALKQVEVPPIATDVRTTTHPAAR